MDESANADAPEPGDVSSVRVCFGENCLDGDSIESWAFEGELQGNAVVNSATVKVVPPSDFRWDYHAPTTLEGPQGLQHSGFCASATRDSGVVTLHFEDLFQDLSATTIRNLEFFGMTPEESIYWLATLATEGGPVEVEGLRLDRTQRPFLYAVPLQGLSLEGGSSILAGADFGVGFGEGDTAFQPILAASQLAKTQPVWAEGVPKAWGVVFAHDLVEAESLALTRAHFTVDLLNLALSGGLSHFETRYEKLFLDWDAEVGKNHIALEPWVMLREVQDVKGWIKALPLIERRAIIQLERGLPRVNLFFQHFAIAMRVGDVQDQTKQSNITVRERNLAEGIRRSLRWLGIARKEASETDRLVATWVALESIVNAVEYPAVFSGERFDIKDQIRSAFDAMKFPVQDDIDTNINAAFIKNRVLQNDWPLRVKLKLFGRSLGLKIDEEDIKFIGRMGKKRAETLHGGQDATEVDREEVRRLALVTERLIVGGSIFGYNEVEDTAEDQLVFGDIGPEGGAPPLYVNGEELPFTLTIPMEGGEQLAELIAGGKIYEMAGVQVSEVGGDDDPRVSTRDLTGPTRAGTAGAEGG